MNATSHRLFERALLGCALSLGASLSGCDGHANATAGAPGGPPPPFEVTVVRVEPRDIAWAPVHVAQTAASREVEVRTRVAGLLIERAFDEGSFVHAGDVLFRIDPRPFEAARQAAAAQLSEARARIEEAERTVARKQKLVESEAVAQRELDDARTGLALAHAQAEGAQAQLARAALDLEFTTVSAPLDGRVGKVVREAGCMVDTMMNPLLTTIWRIDPIYVSFRVSERELLAARQARESGAVEVAEGQDELRVAVELIDGTPFPHEGRINYRSVRVDPATGTAEVRAELPNPGETLLPGQFVRVRVLGLVRRNVLSVPQRAVQMSQASSLVYVVGEGEQVQAREVKLASWEGRDWLVESGLAAGERVVVDGLQKIRPGATVKAVEAAPAK